MRKELKALNNCRRNPGQYKDFRRRNQRDFLCSGKICRLYSVEICDLSTKAV